MLRPIYLDTARIGSFHSQAKEAHESFLSLVGETPTSPMLIPFLREGAQAWPSVSRQIGNVLSTWGGIQEFEKSIANLFGASDDSLVLIASRSTSLVRFGTKQLFKNCRRCCTVDLCWQNYLQELRHAAMRSNNQVFVCNVRKAIHDEQVTVPELCEMILRFYRENHCDGLFVPAVDHLGCRLPVAEMVRYLRRQRCEVRFVMIDAAQALGHVPLAEDIAVADFAVAGTHKWLWSYFPLGVAIAPNGYHASAMHRDLTRSIDQQRIDDGLLKFLQQLKSQNGRPTETVNLGPLLSAFGAVTAAVVPTPELLHERIRNAKQVSILARTVGWRELKPSAALRTGILLIDPQIPDADRHLIDAIVPQLARRSIHATVYESGLVRMAMPSDPLTEHAFARLRVSFEDIPTNQRSPFSLSMN